jgi:hypothetical protein
MYDNIFLTENLLRPPGLACRSAGVFLRDYMLATAGDAMKAGYPMRTFAGGRYIGGASDHLPVYVIFDLVQQ